MESLFKQLMTQSEITLKSQCLKSTRAFSRRTNTTEKANSLMLMESFLKVTGKTVLKMVKAL